jgi:chromosome segregation ATPase
VIVIARNTADGLEQEKIAANNRVAALNQQLALLRQDIASKDNEVDNLRAKKAAYDNLLAKLSQEVDNSRTSYAALQARDRAVKSDVERLSTEVDRSKADVKILNANIAAHKSELEMSRQTLSNIRPQLHGSHELNLHGLACLGAVAVNQPTLILEQIQLALG